MKKQYLIIAITAFSFFARITNVQAQDTTLSFGKYITETPWLVNVGFDIIDNDQKRNPFKIYNRGGIYSGNSPAYNTPAKFAVEKDIYGFRHWKYAKGVSLVLALTSTSLRPHNFLALDAYLKYDLNTLIGDTKIFDPYLLGGAGVSYMDFDGPTSYNGVGPNANGDPNKRNQGKDVFLTINGGLGFNLWIFPNVALNFQTVGKFKTVKALEGTNYYQNSVGLVFKINRCNQTKVEPVVACPYKRSKEAEDALIHLREHINK